MLCCTDFLSQTVLPVSTSIVDPVQEDLTSLASYPEYDIFFHYDAVVFPAGLVKLLKRVVTASR